ncbi:MAG TPA: hypothetical protein VFD13_02240 [Candidatus Kapabacteria bacterium]|nr:hypothetical protein [Candidatus Kapabacteria bacterium]
MNIITEQFDSKRSWIALGLLLIAITSIYAWHLDMPYFGDDYQQVYYNPLHSATAYFFGRPPFAERYIPIQTMVLSLSQWISGPNTWLIRVFNIVIATLVCWLTWQLALRLGLSMRGAVIAAGFVAVSQVAGTAVLMNDSPSQILSTLAGLIALVAAFEYSRSNNRLYLLGILGGIILGFLSKETFVGWFIPILILVSLRYDGSRWHLRGIRSILVSGVPILLFFAAYIKFHSSIGLPNGTFGMDRYNLRIGPNILFNAAQLLFAVLLPLSTVWVYVAIAHRAIGMEIAAGLCVAIMSAIALGGFWRLRKVWFIVLFGAIGSISPVIFLNHVGELYAYSILPFVALLFATGCESLMRSKQITRLVVAFLVVVTTLNLWSVYSKQSMMVTEGQLHRTLLPQLQSIAARLPNKSRLYLVNPVRSGDEYSVFLTRGFHLFDFGENAVGTPIGRNDIDTKVVEEDALDSIMRVSPGVAVTYDTTTLKVRILGQSDGREAALVP